MDLPAKENTTASPAAPPTLCLDFTNTVDWRLRAQPEEDLTSYADLVAWSQGAGLLTAEEVGALLRRAAAQPADAAAALVGALDLRESIYRIFAATATDALPAAGDLA